MGTGELVYLFSSSGSIACERALFGGREFDSSARAAASSEPLSGRAKRAREQRVGGRDSDSMQRARSEELFMPTYDRLVLPDVKHMKEFIFEQRVDVK